jgi:outer membrane protein
MNFLGKNWLSLLAVLLGAAALFSSTMGRQPKIVYAETSVLLSEFSEAVKARQAYDEEKKTWEKNLKVLNDSLQASMDKLKAGYEKSSPEQRQAMRQNLEKWNADLQRYTNAVKSMSQEKEKKLMEPVINKMNGYLKIWGEEHGYDLILGTMTGGNILQANSALNVTSRLLVDLNQHYKDLPSGTDQADASSAAKTGAASQGNPVPKDSAKTSLSKSMETAR